ncbi:hypothetical protein TNCV_2224691 [Trichonephila clavipes]|nr:hypothetical protein TNCV_2224691 [Trichonephila clavipes]
MTAIELESHVRSNGRSMLYPENLVQEDRNAQEPHHEPSCVIIYSFSFTVFSRKLQIIQVGTLGIFYVLPMRNLAVQS